jgi:hypothetical protein
MGSIRTPVALPETDRRMRLAPMASSAKNGGQAGRKAHGGDGMPLLTPPEDATSNDASSSPALWSDDAAIIPARRSDVREYQVDDEAVLFDPTTSKLCFVNCIALTVWHYCDGRVTFRQVAEMLSGEYDIAFETALDHVEEILAALSSMNLLDHDEA